MTPAEAAAARVAAIESLQAELAGHVTALQRSLYEGLLDQLQATYDDPSRLPALLAEFTQAVQLPLLVFYGQQLLTLPGLALDYAQAAELPGDIAALRAPLDAFLRRRYGIGPAGQVLPGGQMALFAGDTAAARALTGYAYRANLAGVGVSAYRAGLAELIQGVATPSGHTLGVYEALYREAGDEFSRADRALQTIVADKLNLHAYLYQGGLIASSRAFCKVRDGRCFTDAEIKRFGTKADTYGGYTNKAEGQFAGKSEPYEPFTDLGGYNCRHTIHPVPNLIALRLRPDLMENAKGELMLR